MNTIDLKSVIWKEGKYYVAWCLNVGISSFGETKKEALDSLREALDLYFEDEPVSKVIKVIKVEQPDIVPLEFQHA